MDLSGTPPFLFCPVEPCLAGPTLGPVSYTAVNLHTELITSGLGLEKGPWNFS